ncbi:MULTISPECIES: YkvA family protein [Aeromonas]|uniref:YkvA family protein n=1 Tax=Aeromonas TaxID=642 RepID=UPI000693A3C5|nr:MULTISPECIES: YkvA family protein [Aeromonas]
MTEINRSSLLAKLKHIKGMKLLVEQAVLLYLLMTDEQTPVWIKTIVVSALAYLLCPVDAVPDFIPGVGLTDDLGVISGAIASLGSHIHQGHRSKAADFFK